MKEENDVMKIDSIKTLMPSGTICVPMEKMNLVKIYADNETTLMMYLMSNQQTC